MFKRNGIISCALALIIAGALGQTAYAVTTGWEQSNGNWYYYQNNLAKTGWIQDSGKWYYLNPSTGTMQTGWVQDSGAWYYLNSDGSMAHDTTIWGYYLGSNGAWVSTASSSTYTKGKTASEIRDILKRDYKFVDYNAGLLLSPYGKDYHDVIGGYVNYQIAISEIDDNAIKMNILKNDSETTNDFKAILNMIFPDKTDEVYSIVQNFMSSGVQQNSYSFDGKTLLLYNGGNSQIYISIK
ncbi:cell wall binding repeat-containing protein [Clostridium sp. DL-VIII]|nr:cell wall binding repeat-containing protein [Clostridium sp. DL-VIII]